MVYFYAKKTAILKNIMKSVLTFAVRILKIGLFSKHASQVGVLKALS